MARENQGLQIALIIFVMLAVVLGVAFAIEVKYRGEDKQKQGDAEKIANDVRAENSKLERDCRTLQDMIGVEPPTMAVDDVKKKVFDEDMAPYKGNFPDDDLKYRKIFKHLREVNQKHESALTDAKLEIQTWKDKYVAREAGSLAQIKTIDEGFQANKDDVVKATNRYKEDRATEIADENNLKATLVKIQRDEQEHVRKAEEQVQQAMTQIKELAKLNQDKNKKLHDFDRKIPDTFNGEVRWVNQHDGTVWIDLGRADGLDRGISFSVYPADTSNIAKAASKASVEVTKVTGEHMAECRVTQDKVADPIMPNDKLFTPLWTAGERRHFALVGFLDLTGEGRSDHQAVCNLITMNGGVIDCDADKGKRTGPGMTINTNFLITGEAPNEKTPGEDMNLRTNMFKDAERLGVRVISLSDLKQQMGYHNSVEVKHYGSRSGASDQKAAKAPAASGDAAAPAPRKKAPAAAPADE